MSRRQYGALPFRVHDGKLQVMLITSRETKRWIVPKGWPHGTQRQTARTEAYEERRQGKNSSEAAGVVHLQEEAPGPQTGIGGPESFSARRQKAVEEVAGKEAAEDPVVLH
jgi:hypothetical protein